MGRGREEKEGRKGAKNVERYTNTHHLINELQFKEILLLFIQKHTSFKHITY
jgi:hypothetical protein